MFVCEILCLCFLVGYFLLMFVCELVVCGIFCWFSCWWKVFLEESRVFLRFEGASIPMRGASSSRTPQNPKQEGPRVRKGQRGPKKSPKQATKNTIKPLNHHQKHSLKKKTVYKGFLKTLTQKASNSTTKPLEKTIKKSF